MRKRNQKVILGLTSQKTKKKSSRTPRQRHTKLLSKAGELGDGWQVSRNSVSSSLPNRGIRELRPQAGKEAAGPLVSVGVTHGARGTRARLLGPEVEMWTRVKRRLIAKAADKLDIGRGIHSALK